MTTKRVLSLVMALALVLSLIVIPAYATTEPLIGDLNGDGAVNSDDVVDLLLFLTMPDLYPLEGHAEFTGDGTVDSDDAIQLLLFCNMPDLFPLQPPTEEPEEPMSPAEIVYAAYSLGVGETLEGTYTLTGEITNINTPYSEQFENVSVTIVVDGLEEFPILCYRLKGEGIDQIGKGDTITVTGSLTNYNGTIEFAQGCTLDAWEDTGAEEILPETPAEIVYAAYALEVGETLTGRYTLTGEITSVDTPYDEGYKNVTVTIVVEDMVDFPIVCFRLKGEGADQIAAGDIITVTGVLKNYNGTVEFDSGCTLDAWERPETPVEPPVTELVLGDNAVSLEAEDLDGATWTYTAGFTGNLKIDITALAYDYVGEGEFYQVPESDLPFAFSRTYCMTIDGVEYHEPTATIAVTEGQVVEVNLMGYSAFATKATLTLSEAKEDVGGDDAIVSTQDVSLAVGDVDGETISYVAQATGNLNITVTALSYDWMGEGEYTEVPAGDLPFAFGRMYCMTVDGTQYYQYSVDVAVVADQLVEVNLISANGYATNATITFTETAGEGGEPTEPTEPSVPGEPDGTMDNPYVIDVLPYTINFFGGMDQYYVYTAAATGNVVVSYLEGGLLTLPNGEAWDTDDATNAYVIPVEAGYTLVLNPWTMQPELSGEMVVSFVEGEGPTEPSDPSEPSVEPTEPPVPGEPDGSMDNPYVIDALPYTVSFYGGMDKYYVYTTTEAGQIVVSHLEGAMLTLMNGENWEQDEAGNYVVPVEAGYELLLNLWTMEPELSGEMVVSFVAGSAEPTEPSEEPTEPSVPASATYVFSDYKIEGELGGGQFFRNLDDVVTANLSSGWFTGELRVYKNANVVFSSTVAMDSIVVNAGYKDSTFDVYVSEDGETWTLYQADVAYTSAYSDITIDLPDGCKNVQLVADMAQLRLKTMTVVFAGGSAPVEPTEPSVEPTEPSVEPTEPSAEPTEPSAEPTEPSAEPTEPSAPAVAYITEPVVGQAYKFMLTQKNLGKELYITGAMDSYYYATTEDAAAAATVYFEEAEGGYRVYFLKDGVKTYLEMVKSGTHNNVVFVTTPTKVLKWNAEIASVTCDIEGTDFYFGTYGTYKTFSASKLSYVTGNGAATFDETNFVGHFYVTEGEAPVEPTEPSVEPTEPSVEPTEPSVEPTEPSVEPTEPSAPAVEAGYNKITSIDQLVSGQYVLVVNSGYAPGVVDGTWITAAQPVVSGDKVTDTKGAVWTLNVTEQGVSLKDANGVFIAPKGGNNNGIKTGTEYFWAIEVQEDGTFRFVGTGADTVILASNSDAQYGNKFRAYKSTTVTNYADSYPSFFTLYLFSEGETPVEPTEPTEPSVEPTVPSVPETPAEIVYAAYGLGNGETLEGTYTLTGEISAINTPYSEQYGNVTVTIVVEGMEAFPIMCYRLKGEGADKIGKGDIITVTGSLTNYNGTIQFAQGCTLDAWEDVGVEETLPTTPEEIVNAAYALGTNEALAGTYTLTGVITEINTAYSDQYKNVTVTIVVAGMTDKPIMCFRLKGEGADKIAVGDTITVTGAIKNYNGTVEFDSGCTLDAWQAGAEPVLTWQEYVAMTGAEQKAFKESFENSADYYAWLEDAQAKYDAEHETVMDGVINLGDLVNKS